LTIRHLSKGIVYIYFVNIDNCNIPIQYLFVLNKEELEVYSRCVVALKKIEFLVRRVLAKGILSVYLGTRPENINFIKNKFGKLYLNENLKHSIGESLQFNISHGDNMVVFAFTLKNEIGVDVEKINGPIFNIYNSTFGATGQGRVI
jgi:4'-phosphopantetheinyl transferase